MQMTAEEVKAYLEQKLEKVQLNICTPGNKNYLREYEAQEWLLQDILKSIR